MSDGPTLPAHLRDAAIRVDSIPAEGRELVVTPDAGERESVAAQLGLTSLDRFEARLKATKFRGGLRVTGRLEAELVQPSVVSLEPVTQQIDESVDRVFLPTSEIGTPASKGEVFVDIEGDDPPDHFSGPEVDLSNLIIETLALAVDPYPRAEGETLELPGPADIEAENDSPFKALKTLKEKSEKGD